MLTDPTLEFVDYILIPKNVDFKVNILNVDFKVNISNVDRSTFFGRPSVAQKMSNDEHLLGVSGAAGVLAVAQQVSLLPVSLKRVSPPRPNKFLFFLPLFKRGYLEGPKYGHLTYFPRNQTGIARLAPPSTRKEQFAAVAAASTPPWRMRGKWRGRLRQPW